MRQGAALTGVVWGTIPLVLRAADGDPWVKVFYRVAFAAVVIGIWMLATGRWREFATLDTRERWQLATQGLLLTANWLLFLTALDLTEVATTGFFDGNGLAWYPMRGFDAHHDLDPKTLPGGATLPARTASVPDTGAATLADVDAAIDVLAERLGHEHHADDGRTAERRPDGERGTRRGQLTRVWRTWWNAPGRPCCAGPFPP